MLFVCHPKILHKHCLQFVLGVEMAPRETETGADPGSFLGGGALVSCSTSTPINHIVFLFFFFAEYQLY